MNYTVTSDADDGSSGTLRAILATVNSNLLAGSTIHFSANVTHIHLTRGPLPINVSIAIVAAHKVTIDGGFLTNILTINTANTNLIVVQLTDLVLVDANSGTNGAAINAQKTHLTLTDCSFEANQAISGASGGAISALNCVVQCNNCLINNGLVAATGNNAYGAGIYSINSTLELTNCVLSANGFFEGEANCFGSGIYISGGTLSATKTVFINNSNGGITPTGSAIYVEGDVIAVNVDSCTFQNNGNTVFVNRSNSTTHINRSTFTQNSKGPGYIGAGNLNNCTFNGNNVGILVEIGIASIVNCTIVHNGTGILAGPTSGVRIGNTIVATNTTDVSGSYQSSGGNFIGFVGKNTTGFTSTDQVGTLSAIDPQLNPIGFYGGPTETLTAKLGSPVINAGININVNSTTDQRGFNRIVDGTVDIGSTESQKVCLAGNSKVLVKLRTDNSVENIPIKNVSKSAHLVYSVVRNTFVPILHNVVSGNATQFIKIKKNSIDNKTPTEDLYITSGHVVKIGHKYLKACEVLGCEKVKLESQPIYTICTQTKDVIRVAGMEVTTYSEKDWWDYSNEKGISWKDNLPLD